MGLPIRQFCFLLLCSISFITAQQNTCQQVIFPKTGLRTKWFGPDCKYLCHCKDNDDCEINGDCPTGCAIGWFGPACQYADMMINNSLQNYYLVAKTTDNNNDTCADSPLEITWNTNFLFTWMRVIVGRDESNKDLNISFAANSVQTACPSLKNVIIDDKTLDIFCSMDQLIQQILITGAGIKLCSIYVSAGRNVALKQKTDQRSTIGNLVSTKAVDGNHGEEWYDFSCIEINGTGTTPPKWTIEFPMDLFAVYRFKLYNRFDCCSERLSGFTMNVFDNSKIIVYNFSNQPPTNSSLYSIQPDRELIISSVEIMVPRPHQSESIINLCEVEIFGDSYCSKDQQTGFYRYGRDCENICNCAVPGEKCFVSTGNCPSGCKAGFYGQGCNSTCNPKFYGVDCLNRCNDSCKDQLCDSVNGHCIHCAAPGKRPPVCVDDCNLGSYGDDCTMNCSMNCMDGNCNEINGTCFDCKPGFYGTYCNTSCPSECENSACDRYSGHCNKCSPGFYDIICNTTCPENCHETGCDFLSGNCTSCKVGFQGSRCGEECTGNTYGDNCKLTCNNNCNNNTLLTSRTCNKTDGNCLYGCQGGFDGDRCDSSIKSGSAADNTGNDNSTLIGAVVGAICGLIVVTLIIIGIIVWRRRGLVKKSQRRHEVTDHTDTSRHNYSNQDDISHDNIVIKNTTQLVDDSHDIKVKVKPAVPKKPTLTISKEKSEKSVKGSGTGYYNTVTLPTGPPTTVVTLANLPSYLLTHGKEYLYKEFQNLPTNSEATMSVGLSEENKNKNRYKNICAYDHSRVHLVVNTSKKHGDYINASYLQGFNDEEKFIASQGPTKVILDDFVRMLWEQKVDKVVMLTNLYEHGKSKCDPYWPEEDEVVFGEITVKLAATQVFADYVIRRLQLSKDAQTMHPVTQFHFTSWPDKGVPENPWALVDFEQRVAASPTTRPIVVHCSAGVGRTGTFIALRNVMREAEVTQKMDFFNTVAKLRKDRYLMVQTQEQYVFLHEAAKVAMVCLNTTITSDNIVERFQQLEKKNISGKSKLEQEFEMVCDVCVDDGETIEEEGSAGVMYQNSRTVSNKLKNRFGNILPKDCYRPLLMRESSDMEDYINAVLTPSFTKRNQDVITQLPLPTTVLDFWRLITQLKISLVVAFEEQLMTTDSTIGYYLPTDENQPASCPPFQIKMGSCVQGSEWEERKLTVSGPKGAEEHSLVHLRYTETGTDPMKLLTFIKHARTYNPKHNERTLYMCRNGATYSGLACVLTLLLDRMDNDLRLTVPLVVGAIKAIRSQVIPAVNQYKILYQILKLYSETNSIYSNFNDTKSSVAPEASGKDNGGFVGNEGTEYANAKL